MPPMSPYLIIIMSHQLYEDVGSVRKWSRHMRKYYFQNFTIVLLSNSIRIALWRSDGFLHSFRDFSESMTSSENLIRTKFILHKIFFQMSTPSSSQTSWMFFNLHSKMTRLDFQLIIIITFTIQVAVLNRFSWNSLSWCGSTHRWTQWSLETIGLIEPLIWGKKGRQNRFFGYGMGFSEKKISKSYSVPSFP